MDHRHHKFFIGLISIIILIIGLLLGVFLAANLRFVDLEAITLALLLTTIILLLIIGGLVLEIKDILIPKTAQKTKKKK